MATTGTLAAEPAPGEDAAPVEERQGSQSIAAVERAIDVLLLFGRGTRPHFGVTEISSELGLSKAAVHRILTSLRTRDLVVLDTESRRYSLGPAALSLGRAYLSRIDVRTMAATELAWLSQQTRETATLSIRSGDVRMYIDQVIPDREVRMEVAFGVPYPLHAGSSSKAFLAFLRPDEIDTYVGKARLAKLTDATLDDPDDLTSDLAVIRERGYALSFGERQAGAASVAAPVFDHDHRPVAVLSVSGPSERFRDEVQACAAVLLQATARLSARMGDTGP